MLEVASVTSVNQVITGIPSVNPAIVILAVQNQASATRTLQSVNAR